MLISVAVTVNLNHTATRASTAAQLEQCISDVGHLMSANKLKLSVDKTESDRYRAFLDKVVVSQDSIYDSVPTL